MFISIRPPALIVSVVATTFLLIASGLVTGRMTRRWGTSTEFERARQLVKDFPEKLGDWTVEASMPLEQKAIDMLQCGDAFFDRQYKHSQLGNVRVTLVAGPYGPLSVHKPSVCYPNIGLLPIHSPQEVTVPVGGQENSFWSAQFMASDAGARPHQVYYAWSEGRAWVAASNPRFAFGGAPVLFKLQLDTDPATGANPDAPDAGRAFLDVFLPAWNQLFIPSSGK